MTETWKSVPGYYGCYEASSYGRLRSVAIYHHRAGRIVRRSAPKIRKPSYNRDGYLRFRMSRGPERFNHQAHSIIALTFLGPRNQGQEVCHIDGNRQNNAIENLEYGTKAENMRHRDLHGTTAKGDRHGMRIHKGLVAGERNGKARLTSEIVLEIRRRYKQGHTQAQLAGNYGIKEPAVWKILNRRTWKHIHE